MSHLQVLLAHKTEKRSLEVIQAVPSALGTFARKIGSQTSDNSKEVVSQYQKMNQTKADHDGC